MEGGGQWGKGSFSTPPGYTYHQGAKQPCTSGQFWNSDDGRSCKSAASSTCPCEYGVCPAGYEMNKGSTPSGWEAEGSRRRYPYPKGHYYPSSCPCMRDFPAGICGTNQHVSNGKCVDCPPGTTSGGGDDPSKGVDTGCDCASTVKLGWFKNQRGHLDNSGCVHGLYPLSSNSNAHSFNSANGELVVHACVHTIVTDAFQMCDKIKKVTFNHTLSNRVVIEESAFDRAGVEIVDVPPLATLKKYSFFQASSLKRLDFRGKSDYRFLKIDAQAFNQAGLRGKEVVLCVPLIYASTPPSA